jgi:hypothetical protein
MYTLSFAPPSGKAKPNVFSIDSRNSTAAARNMSFPVKRP